MIDDVTSAKLNSHPRVNTLPLLSRFVSTHNEERRAQNDVK